ncbi:MAG: sigma-E factor negative regulatory protein [Pseudomonadales bacterium]
MSEKLKEALSAVIDGEADEFELRRVLDEIGKDATLAASWERYHLIGAVLRRERVSRSVGMRERVWAEVGLEEVADVAAAPIPASEVPAAATPRLRRWTPAAVAATVAIAAAVGFFSVSDFAENPGVQVAEVSTPEARQSALNDASVALTSEVTPVDQARTEAYVIRHLQQLGMNRSGIGFAKMVAYERN